jgi:dihydrofolate reductase
MSDFADAFDAVNKIVVFSRTLDKMEGTKTSIVDTDLKETILKLKQEEGKDILLGGVDVPSQLIGLDLIDEYRFVVHPLIVGEGRRLLDGTTLPQRLHLKLVESKAFRSGSVALHYVK